MPRSKFAFYLLTVFSIILVPIFGRAIESSNTPAKVISQLPMSFEPNLGQVDARVLFLARGQGYRVFLTRSEAVIALRGQQQANLRMALLGANATPRIEGVDPLPGKINYLFGDSRNWHTNIPTFRVVRQTGVYPGIDLTFYGNQNQLEYDFVLAPGARPEDIKYQLNGVQKISLTPEGDLNVEVAGRALRLLKPIAYQSAEAKHRPVAVAYRLLENNKIAFAIGAYDASKTLVIDPVVVYSTYLGGSTDADPFNGVQPPHSASNESVAVAADTSGNTYLTGTTSALEFPVTGSAYDTTENGSSCSPHGGRCFSGFVTKINSTGTALVYSTYFGSGPLVRDIAISGDGRAYIVGSVSPGTGGIETTANAFQQSPSCEFCSAMGFLSVLNASGSGLVYSTLFGSANPELDESQTNAESVSVGTTGIAYIAGNTSASDMPTTSNAYQPAFAGGNDVFVAKFDPSKSGASSLLYSTYLGSTNNESAGGVATEGGRVYVVGATDSPNFPISASAYDRTYGGNTDGFITKIDTNIAGQGGLIYSSFLGGSQWDAATSVSLLGSTVTVGGATQSTNFPVTASAFRRTHSGSTGCQAGIPGGNCMDGFVLRLNSSGSGLTFSTYFGGSGDDRVYDVAVDASDTVYLAGSTTSSNLPKSADALQSSYRGNTDAFFARLSSSGSSLLYGTYLGGAGKDLAEGVTTRSGQAYLTGWTTSTNLPVSTGSIQSSRVGATDAFVAKFKMNTANISCSSPSTSRTIHLCSPGSGSTVSSPLRITAKAKAGTSSIKRMSVWVDGVKKYEFLNNDRIDALVSSSSGTRTVTVQGTDSSGNFKTSVRVTVK